MQMMKILKKDKKKMKFENNIETSTRKTIYSVVLFSIFKLWYLRTYLDFLKQKYFKH